MDSNSMEFALFIDGIRLERGISREDLIYDIVSLSQYKRYLRGITAIPNNIVIELADKLRYSINDFYSLFTSKHNSELSTLMDIYDLIQNHKFEDALTSCQKMKDELIVTTYNKLFYDYCFLFSQYKLGKISDVHILSIFSDLVNYPECMDNESFNMIEMNILMQIVTISSHMDNYGPAELFYAILTNPSIIINYSGKASVLPIIFYYTARVFRQQNKLEETLKLSDDGIQIALSYETSNALPHLFLINALANKELGNISDAYQSIKKCFLQLIVLNKPEQTKIFKSTYENNFEVSLSELLSNIPDLL